MRHPLRTLRLTLLALACLAGAPALAATYLVVLPTPVTVGDEASELYVPRGFQAHDGLAGTALADAALAEIGRALGPDAAALKVAFKGSAAEVTVEAGRAQAPEVVDRALGAVFHTLALAGIEEVRVGDRVLTAESFTRGALLPVLPLVDALPPRKLAHGFVLVDGKPLEVAEVARRVAARDPSIRTALETLLRTGSPDVKLAVLGKLDAAGVKDASALVLPRLQDADVRVRLAALRRLQGDKDPKVLAALEAVVDKDPDAAAKSTAARILVDAGRPEYKKYLLLEKLGSANAGDVLAAARELLATGDAKLAPALGGLVRHANPEVRAVGVEALRTYKDYGAMQAAVAGGEVAKDAAAPLARTLADDTTGPARAAGIAWLLANGDEAQATHAAKVAGEARVAGTTDALGKALGRPEPAVRRAAAAALGELKDAQGLEPLAKAVRSVAADDERAFLTEQAIAIIAVQPLDQVIRISESPDATIRELAVKSLAEFAKDRPNPRVVGVLKTHLASSEQPIRRAAVHALARIADPSIVDELVKLKDDRDAEVRQNVAYAVARSKHPQADMILLGYLDDGDNRVKLEAVEGVRARGVSAALDKLRWLVEYRQVDIRRAVMKALLALAPAGDAAMFDVYQQRLYDDDAAIRLMAVEALSQYPNDPRTAAALGGAVSDQDPAVKRKALDVLAASPDPNAVEQVIRGLFDPSADIKLAALGALEKLASPKATKALQEFILNETDDAVKKRANEVLERL